MQGLWTCKVGQEEDWNLSVFELQVIAYLHWRIYHTISFDELIGYNVIILTGLIAPDPWQPWHTVCLRSDILTFAG